MRTAVCSILLFIFGSFSYSQQENYKWGKGNNPYLIQLPEQKRDYTIQGDPAEVTLKTIAAAYWILISDVDGDNCPFKPSCSSFLIESIQKTNIVQGTLMFFDRFTRDMNIIDRNSQYPIKSNRLDDPVIKYTLSEAILNEYYSEEILTGE